MSLVDIFKRNKVVDELYLFVEKSEEKQVIDRAESWNYLKKANSLYHEIIKERGSIHILKNYPDIPDRINELVKKLTEYNS